MLRTALLVLCGAMLPVAAAMPAAEPDAAPSSAETTLEATGPRAGPGEVSVEKRLCEPATDGSAASAFEVEAEDMAANAAIRISFNAPLRSR
jgi:hypothetical protein